MKGPLSGILFRYFLVPSYLSTCDEDRMNVPPPSKHSPATPMRLASRSESESTAATNDTVRFDLSFVHQRQVTLGSAVLEGPYASMTMTYGAEDMEDRRKPVMDELAELVSTGLVCAAGAGQRLHDGRRQWSVTHEQFNKAIEGHGVVDHTTTRYTLTRIVHRLAQASIAEVVDSLCTAIGRSSRLLSCDVLHTLLCSRCAMVLAL